MNDPYIHTYGGRQNYSEYYIRFTIDIEQDESKIKITPRVFRCSTSISGEKWYKLKSSKLLITEALAFMKDRVERQWDLKNEKLNITTDNRSLIVEVKH